MGDTHPALAETTARSKPTFIHLPRVAGIRYLRIYNTLVRVRIHPETCWLDVWSSSAGWSLLLSIPRPFDHRDMTYASDDRATDRILDDALPLMAVILGISHDWD